MRIAKWFMFGPLMFLGCVLVAPSLFAQPTVIYTYSGTPGNYLLDFTLENTTLASQGSDLYFFGVYADGGVAGTPANYNGSTYTTVHTLEVGNAYNWPFNDTWIDLTYGHLFPGMSLSGFDVLDTDATVPTSIQYFAFGENNGRVYTGPGNQNTNNPTNPLFVGNAVLVPEPSILSLAGGAFAVLVFRRARFKSVASN